MDFLLEMQGSGGQMARRSPSRLWALGWVNEAGVALPIPRVAAVISDGSGETHGHGVGAAHPEAMLMVSLGCDRPETVDECGAQRPGRSSSTSRICPVVSSPSRASRASADRSGLINIPDSLNLMNWFRSPSPIRSAG